MGKEIQSFQFIFTGQQYFDITKTKELVQLPIPLFFYHILKGIFLTFAPTASLAC